MSATLDARRAARRGRLRSRGGSRRHRGGPGGRTGPSAAKTVNVAFIYPKTGGLAAFGARGVRRLPGRPRLHEGQVRRVHHQSDLRRRRHRPCDSDRAFKSEVGQGVQDHRRHRFVGHRAPARAARRPEQRPLHRRRRGGGRDHGAEPQHVPRRPADAARTSSTRRTSSRRSRRARRSSSSPRTRRSAQGNVAAVAVGLRQQGPHGLEDPRRRSAPPI